MNAPSDVSLISSDLGGLADMPPGEARALANMGLVALQEGDLPLAADSLAKAVALAPGVAQLHFRLGVVQFNLGRNGDALNAFVRAYELDRTNIHAHHNIAASLMQGGRTDTARKIFKAVVKKDPAYEMSWVGLAECFRAAGDLVAAAEALTKALAINPNNTAARHMLDAYAGRTPAKPERAYVENLFDMYAPRFDSHLRGALKYSAPEEIVALLAQLKPRSGRFERVLDLGCGTGLLGAALQTAYGCPALVGIDLSQNMLREAAKRGCYTELYRAEILEYLSTKPPAFDLIGAADVFIYVGDLREVFAACAARLAPGGLLVFSVEQVTGDGFVLRDNARYAHAREYLRATAAAAGLRIAAEREGPLRHHGHQPEMALYMALERAS